MTHTGHPLHVKDIDGAPVEVFTSIDARVRAAEDPKPENTGLYEPLARVLIHRRGLPPLRLSTNAAMRLAMQLSEAVTRIQAAAEWPPEAFKAEPEKAPSYVKDLVASGPSEPMHVEILCNDEKRIVHGWTITGAKLREICCRGRPEQLFAQGSSVGKDRLIQDSDTVDLRENRLFYSVPAATTGGE